MSNTQEQNSTDTTNKVRDSRNQINFLKQKYAADPVNNTTTPAQIDALQAQLGQIPNSEDI